MTTDNSRSRPAAPGTADDPIHQRQLAEREEKHKRANAPLDLEDGSPRNSRQVHIHRVYEALLEAGLDDEAARLNGAASILEQKDLANEMVGAHEL